MSHHSASLRSVENVITVPWKFMRARRRPSASSSRSLPLGTFFTRFNIPDPVDQRRGGPQRRVDRDRVEHVRLGLVVARQRVDRGELADGEVRVGSAL